MPDPAPISAPSTTPEARSPGGDDDALDKRGETIQEMFAGVAPRYDLLNHVLSLGLDVWWRRQAARAVPETHRDRVLDLCSGTGDQAISLHRRGARVTAADFCVPMVAHAAPKYEAAGADGPAGLAGDAMSLPFADGQFRAVTVSFGVRNVSGLDGALTEMARVLEPGGVLVILEFAMPVRQPIRAGYSFYFHRILPIVGRVVSERGSAYRYLPDSVEAFPQRAGFVERIESAGFHDGRWRDLSGGTVCLYTATRADDPTSTAGGGVE